MADILRQYTSHCLGPSIGTGMIQKAVVLLEVLMLQAALTGKRVRQ